MHLHEEVLLLALRDSTGKIDWKAGSFKVVMAGAIIGELLFAERITVDVDGKKLVTVVDETPPGDPILDEALALIKTARRRRKIQHWIAKLSALKDLKEKTARALCDQGVLKAEEAKILFVFTTTHYPELDPEPEKQLIARLEQAIFGEDEEVDIRTGLLISLTHSSGLLAIPLSARALRQRKKRIKEISSGDLVGKATAETIAAAQAAMAVVAIMPAMTVTTSGGGGSSGC